MWARLLSQLYKPCLLNSWGAATLGNRSLVATSNQLMPTMQTTFLSQSVVKSCIVPCTAARTANPSFLPTANQSEIIMQTRLLFPSSIRAQSLIVPPPLGSLLLRRTMMMIHSPKGSQQWFTFNSDRYGHGGLKQPLFFNSSILNRFKSNVSFSTMAKPDKKVNMSQSSSHSQHTTIVLSRHDIENFIRSHGNAAFKLTIGITMFLFLTVYIFREYIRENMADEVADVASRSLSDVQVVNQANIISKTLIQDILNDEQTQNAAIKFITQLAEQQETKIALQRLLIYVINDPHTLQQLTILSKKVLDQLMQDEVTKNKLLSYMEMLMKDANTQATLQRVLNNVIGSQQTKDFVALGLRDVIASDVVSHQSIELGKHVCQEVVADKKVQSQLSNSVWSVLKRSLSLW
ncbi:hypothetical protein TrispH2_003718 [Trichoplax sp. H2]|nr:hypothetical protein TrispH2_003718 [Trichoplax sp. H2]|eukprot:RDD44566.1 hypothetical protein TrispH2_003718 [Trichoplax sp. H2]